MSDHTYPNIHTARASSRVVLARFLERARARPRMSRARAVVDDDVFDSLDSLARRELASAIASRCADASRAMRAHERASVAATAACATHAANARAAMRECSATMRDVVREWRWMTSEETIRALEGALEEARAFRELAERFERACDDAVARSGRGVGSRGVERADRARESVSARQARRAPKT